MYEKMRLLLERSFGLKELEVFLPKTGWEEGLEIPSFLRDIGGFVKKYGYNLFE